MVAPFEGIKGENGYGNIRTLIIKDRILQGIENGY